MPFTYNGIGTTYYGSKNTRTRTAECEFCHRVTQISEYEARHWFVVFFVPIIPLGRKQILDDCSACRRHRAVPLAQWHELKERAIGERTAAFSVGQDDPQAAIELLQTLSAFGNYDEAEKLAQGIQERFDDDAAVQVRMGDWHDFRSRRAEAAECYRKAYKLQPENLAAKRAVAALTILEGFPDQAQAMIASAPQITPQQDADLYVLLAQGFQQQARHSEALSAYQEALAVNPALARDKEVRKLVRISEKNDPAGMRVLPPVPLYTSKLAWGAAAALLAAALFGGLNWWIGEHRRLHIVNGFDVPLAVTLDEGPAIELEPRSWQVQELAEGPHRAVVRAGGQPLASDEFRFDTSFWSRLWTKPVFILNAGRGAALVWEQTVYARVPRDEGTGRLEVGEPFVVFDNVDYTFAPFPATLKIKGDRTVTKTRVDAFPLEPEQVFLVADGASLRGDPYSYLEAHLAVAPESKDTLQAYVRAAAVGGQMDRARRFIASGLDSRPVRIEWHRMAHGLDTDAGGEARLRQGYAEQLQQEPENSALLYLAGRLETDSSTALDLFQRSITADPENPYPWYAIGFQRMVTGDFVTAEKAYHRAATLVPDDADFAESWRRSRLALGQFDALRQAAADRLESEPIDFLAYEQLMEVLGAQGKMDEAARTYKRYVEALQIEPAGDSSPATTAALARSTLAYLQRDYDMLLMVAPELDETWRQSIRFQSHLEQGQWAQAAADLEAVPEGVGPFAELRLAVGWRLAGDAQQADKWQEKACQQLEAGLGRNAEIAALLRAPQEASSKQVQDLAVDVPEKITLLLALAQHAPPEKERFLELAEKLNFSPLFPHHFNRRVIASLRGQQQDPAAGSASARNAP